MSRTFSMRDVLYVLDPSGSRGLSEQALLSVHMDDEVNAVLAQVGFDINEPIEYLPSNHRDMRGIVGIGFRAVGTVTKDPAWLDSPLCDTMERIIFEYRRHPSLAKEMCHMLGSHVDLTSHASEDGSEYCTEAEERIKAKTLKGQLEPQYRAAEERINQLEDLREMVRGCPYRQDGGLKTPADYKEDLKKKETL